MKITAYAKPAYPSLDRCGPLHAVCARLGGPNAFADMSARGECTSSNFASAVLYCTALGALPLPLPTRTLYAVALLLAAVLSPQAQ